MKHTITIIDDDPNSPLLKTDDMRPVTIRRRTDVDWQVLSEDEDWDWKLSFIVGLVLILAIVG